MFNIRVYSSLLRIDSNFNCIIYASTTGGVSYSKIERKVPSLFTGTRILSRRIDEGLIADACQFKASINNNSLIG